MNNQTPAAFGNEGLEKLPGTLKTQIKAVQYRRQGICCDCQAFDPHQANCPGFGYCKRRAPSFGGDTHWPLVALNSWCLEFVPSGQEVGQ